MTTIFTGASHSKDVWTEHSILADRKNLKNDPISIPSSVAGSDDDFEEVPIPAVAGPSSPYPGTPTTLDTNRTRPGTPGTITTAPSVDDDYAEYGRDEVSDADDHGVDKGDSGVIRLEIGGETAEQKAKRAALALRK